MGFTYINRKGKVVFRETKRQPVIEPSFFDNEEELDLADKLAHEKYGKNGYDDLTDKQQSAVRRIIKKRRGL